jgi:hypothetical protein
VKKGCSREAVSALFNGQKESQVVHEVRLNLNSKRSSGFDRDKEDRHARRRDRHESLLLSKFSTLCPKSNATPPCTRKLQQHALINSHAQTCWGWGWGRDTVPLCSRFVTRQETRLHRKCEASACIALEILIPWAWDNILFLARRFGGLGLA